MTDEDKALVEAMKDAVLHGAGFLKNGKHVPIDDVYLTPHEVVIEAQAAEIERLREALKHQGGPLCMARYHPTAECTCGVSAALGETK